MTEEDVPNTTFLKWVVAILGILIIGVASAIGVILYKRATAASDKSADQAEIPAVISPAPASEFGTVDVKIPGDMPVLDIAEAGRFLYVTYGTEDEEPRGVIVLDAGAGKVMGQFVFDN
ncbi:hypothetical protein [Sneathiella glossodoripedis]|uniref:hypothetical protein n=1 Tax=Sneathiella glossodoripedis TaxID=418853 RepID=UPI000471A9E4|nr:hypothetical protein [Sneathiella glossodoripedis]